MQHNDPGFPSLTLRHPAKTGDQLIVRSVQAFDLAAASMADSAELQRAANRLIAKKERSRGH
jgi:hypothetical protein